ncbi:MAG: RagB/SusD family nutrient uptake outer membrane protein [Parabacteroides sp.]|nr:RagB/SusD family nutrient uptake outer membrane protein [Parabacteroides sp.]
MKSLKNKIFTLLITTLLIFNSCTDLSETTYDVITDSGMELSENDIARFTGFAFSNLRYTYWAWNGYFDLMEESSDLLMTPKRIGVGWGDLYINMHKHDFTENIDHFWTIWYYAYVGINYANLCLDMEVVQESEIQSAQLRALRALFYYILLDAFRNIPLETTQDTEDGYLPTQTDPKEVFDFIVSELTEVKEALGTEKKYGYLNKYVACMILAKCYLNYNAWFNFSGADDTDYYELALKEVDDIITNGGYSLAPNYKDCFMADLSGCPEIIFAIPEDDTYASHNYLVNKALISDGAKAFGYNGTPWNGSCAVPQFIDTYAPGDNRLDDTWAHGQQYHYETSEALTTEADDQGTVPLAYTQQVHSIDNPGAYMIEGYRFIKNEIVPGTAGTYGDDVPFFRLADAMFIKAECLLRLGRNEDEAARLVSDVRARAFEDASVAIRTVADLKGESVYDYGHREYTGEGPLNWSGLVATYEGGDDIEFGGLLDDLAWEFVGEHHRRQDLIRFRLAGSRMNVYNGKSWFCKDAITDLAKAEQRNIFPIYRSFIESNMNMEQNPGY